MLGKDLIGKTIISVDEGRRMGAVRGLFVDSDLRFLVGLYLGTEGLFSRKGHCIERQNVQLFGVDAILAARTDVVVDSEPAVASAGWVRREQLQGREVTTPGGTRVGAVDDVILDEEMRIIGFRLGRVFVEGPVAQDQAISRAAVVDVGGQVHEPRTVEVGADGLTLQRALMSAGGAREVVVAEAYTTFDPESDSRLRRLTEVGINVGKYKFYEEVLDLAQDPQETF